jgi:cytochrome oxidase Cu insertion factor (SCO1/SenC/PrrC family)
VPAAGSDPPVPSGAGSWLDRLTPAYLLRSLAAIGAVGIVLIGAAPMALAATNGTADPILAQASDGPPTEVDLPEAPFTLIDQAGRTVTLSSFRGHDVAITFLDPVCTTDCPVIAQEMRLADQMLGSEARSVDLVAVVNNPLYRSTAMTAAFDKQEGLDHVANWSFLTGSLAQLHKVWNDYGVQTAVTPAGSMIAHSDIVYVIDGEGHTRAILDADPGNATSVDQSSFAGVLVNQIRRIAGS